VGVVEGVGVGFCQGWNRGVLENIRNPEIFNIKTVKLKIASQSNK
jgi:hypothetical protein